MYLNLIDVVRLNLDKLDNLKKAMNVLRTKVKQIIKLKIEQSKMYKLIILKKQCNTSTICLMVA